MPTSSCLLPRVFWLIVGGGVCVTCFGRNRPRILPVPPDPLELVTGRVETPQNRDEILKLLERARNNFVLRRSEEAYDLKVSFTVDSLGQTDYDGSWEMEDVNIPGQGLHWTAKSAAGYVATRVSTAEGNYAEGTASYIPLRLHEARGLLNNPLPSPAYANRGTIRSATASFHDRAVTCLLLSGPRNSAIPKLGRAWEEAEECIDPQSGLLQLHSEAPGRYVVYDYTTPFRVGEHVLPQSITVTEAGRVVSKISVESVTPVAGTDSSLVVPTEAMRAGEPAITIKGAVRISRLHRQGRFTAGMTLRAVCVFGVVTPTGQLVEAHSLQPSDPNSDVAVEDAIGIDFSPRLTPGAPPEQRFAFVIEKFLSK